MFNLEWGIVCSASEEDGVVPERFSFVGVDTGVQVLRPCFTKILEPTFKGFKKFHQLTPVHRETNGYRNHLSTVDMIHMNITAAKYRSETTYMPRVGHRLNTPLSFTEENLIERASYNNDIA